MTDPDAVSLSESCNPLDEPDTTTTSAARRGELVTSRILQVGVLTSIAIVLAGVGVTYASHPVYRTSRADEHRLVTRAADFPHTFATVYSGVMRGDGGALIVLGLLVLLATPIVNVAASIVSFAFERDGTFVLIASFVLAVLIGSFFLGTASA